MDRDDADRPTGPAPRPATAAGLAAAGLVLGVAALLPLFALRTGGAAVQFPLFWASIVVLDLAASVASHLVARRITVPHIRRYWRALSLATLLFFAGDLGYLLGEAGYVTGLAEPLTAGRDLSLVLGGGVVLWAMLTYPTSRRSLRDRVSFWLDTGTVLVGAAVLRWYLGVPEGATAAAQWDALATAGVLLLAVFAGARIVVSDDAAAGRVPAVLMIGGTAGEVFCDVLLPLPDLAAAAHYGPLMTVRMLPGLAIALAPVLQLRTLRHGRPAATRAPRRPYSVLPYAMVAAVFALLLLSLPSLSARAVGVLVGALAIVALVVVRQLVAFGDNADLLRRVDRSLADLQGHERRQRALLRHSSDITSIIDRHDRFGYVSPAVTRILGHQPEEVIGRYSHAFLHPDDRTDLEPLMRELRDSPGRTVTYQARYRHADGTWRWLEVITTNLIHEPDVAGLVSNSREVTQARELQDRLRHEASHDPLTQLANRSLFLRRLETALEEWEPGGASVTVVVIDLDDFKTINDSLGHHAGDEALLGLSDVVRGCARNADLAARLGGDEFAVLLPGTTAGEATLVARRFLESLRRPVLVGGQLLRLQASVGVAAAASRDGAEVLRAADAAMYAAKQQGKNCYVVHDAWTPPRGPVVDR
ncbi:hypothetical protein GCM10010124_38830 [Pilimelia terevasa]|uniref:Diguanylate cyclase n=1 Tax=Pilimelia terevasa TaxID=53372 RepID=A0A8J3BVR0_9ACTN|nr:diguanylate cyclase [Pilimelia terevasa]GGK42218.1 hypothetical protein GCM10010124_38830 [Pilimelia terevasa]